MQTSNSSPRNNNHINPSNLNRNNNLHPLNSQFGLNGLERVSVAILPRLLDHQ
jgi:hypothetical protein